jgi:hypothetical protein
MLAHSIAAPAIPTGRPRVTTPMLSAERYAATPSVTSTIPAPQRAQIAGAFEDATPLLGLDDKTVRLIGFLIRKTSTGDWAPGRTPVAWPSRRELCEALNCTASTIKRAQRRAIEAGLIVIEADSQGRRRGHRRDDGEVDYAFGFILSPLRERYAEFQQIVRVHKTRSAEARRLRARIRAMRRKILSYVEGCLDLPIPQSRREDIAATATAYLDLARGLDARLDVEELAVLLHRIEQLWAETLALFAEQADAIAAPPPLPAAFPPSAVASTLAFRTESPLGSATSTAELPVNLDPMGAKNGPDMYHPDNLSLQDGTGRQGASTEMPASSRPGEISDAATPSQTAPRFVAGPGRPARRTPADTGPKLSPTEVAIAVPLFRATYLPPRPSWDDLADVCRDGILHHLQIRHGLWHDANLRLGRCGAVIALATVASRSEFRVSANAYFAGMMTAHAQGKFNLAGCAYALKRLAAARPPDCLAAGAPS